MGGGRLFRSLRKGPCRTTWDPSFFFSLAWMNGSVPTPRGSCPAVLPKTVWPTDHEL